MEHVEKNVRLSQTKQMKPLGEEKMTQMSDLQKTRKEDNK